MDFLDKKLPGSLTERKKHPSHSNSNLRIRLMWTYWSAPSIENLTPFTGSYRELNSENDQCNCLDEKM